MNKKKFKKSFDVNLLKIFIFKKKMTTIDYCSYNKQSKQKKNDQTKPNQKKKSLT